MDNIPTTSEPRRQDIPDDRPRSRGRVIALAIALLIAVAALLAAAFLLGRRSGTPPELPPPPAPAPVGETQIPPTISPPPVPQVGPSPEEISAFFADCGEALAEANEIRHAQELLRQAQDRLERGDWKTAGDLADQGLDLLGEPTPSPEP